MEAKACGSCGVVKPCEGFHKNKNKRGGLDIHCKVCTRERQRRWYGQNQARSKAAARDWQKLNPEQARENALEWAKNNRAKILEYGAKYRAQRLSARHPQYDLQAVLSLRDLACELEALSGEPYAVDHIFPLSKGGPDHHDNLQVIPAAWNSSKSASLTWRRAPAIHWTALPKHVLAMISPENLSAAYTELAAAF